MESCNSGSLQSSCGGDDEYDSRATFMSGGTGQINENPQPPTPFFDPFIASYTQHHDIVNSYPKTTIPSIIDNLNNNNDTTTASNYTFTPPSHPQPATDPPRRNPKKRSRASRRAPTTVLTTDTTNFRAMVQEFTGIPAPPFNNMSSSFARNRFDLLASSIDAPSYLRSSFSPVLPFLGGDNNNNNNNNNNRNNDNIIIGSNSAASSSSTQSLNLFSSINNGEQSPFLGSMNMPSNHHRKIDDSFRLRPKDGGNQQLHGGSVGFFSAANHDQIIGVSNLNNATTSASFDGGLQNLIMPPSSSGNISNLLTHNNQENADDYNYRSIAGKSTVNYPAGLLGSKLNVENRPENNSERQGMVETWIVGSSSD